MIGGLTSGFPPFSGNYEIAYFLMPAAKEINRSRTDPIITRQKARWLSRPPAPLKWGTRIQDSLIRASFQKGDSHHHLPKARHARR